LSKRNLKHNTHFFGVAIILLSSLCFAVVPTAAKTALDLNSSLFVLLLSRCLIGFLFLMPIAIFLRKSILVDKNVILPIFFSSIVSVCLIASTYHALQFLDVAIVLIIMYSFPLGIATITHIRREESIKLTQWICMIFTIIGIAIVGSGGSFQNNLYGISVSFISLILMIIFMYYSSKLVDRIGSLTFNLHMNVWNLFFLVAAYLFFNFPISIPITNEGKFALFCNGIFYILSYTLFFIGSRQIGITKASVLASSEPLFAAVFALIFLKQYLSLLECFGFLLTLGSLYFYQRYKT